MSFHASRYRGLGFDPAMRVQVDTAGWWESGVAKGDDPIMARVAALTRVPWSYDDWAGEAEWVDARLCVHRDGDSFALRPRTRAGCPGDSLCNYGFYRIKRPCNPANFGAVMFQTHRYFEMQARARKLLEARPGAETAANAAAWAAWCREAMRVHSMARWATNIAAPYLAPGPARARVASEILAAKPGAASPAWDNRGLMSMFLPRDLNDITRPDTPPQIPIFGSLLDPTIQTRNTPGAPVQLSTGYTVVSVPWPVGFISGGRSQLNAQWTGNVERDMTGWFQRTIEKPLWVKTETRVRWPKPGPQTFGASTTEERPATFWFGGAKATIRLCVAYLEDVASTNIGTVVAAGLQAFVARLEALPPHLQTMTLSSMGMTVGQAVAAMREAMLATISMVTAAASTLVTAAASAAAVPVVGWVVGAVLLVLTLIVSLSLLFGGAVGGGELAAACIPAPVVRMITDDPDSAPCDFDIRPGSVESRVVEVMPRVLAVRDAAMRSDDVAAWYEASRRAGAPLGPVDVLLDRDIPSGVPWVGLGVLGAVLVGGVLLFRRE